VGLHVCILHFASRNHQSIAKTVSLKNYSIAIKKNMSLGVFTTEAGANHYKFVTDKAKP